MPNVFVLCTGRSGSVTFANACKHITNYSSGHETRVRQTGDARTDYPDNHIEVDNRLIFFAGALEAKYGDEAIYVHLRRNPQEVAESYNRRWHMAEGLMMGWATSIARQTDYGISASRFMVDTVEQNIAQFLSNKPRKLEIWIENFQEGFDQFADLIAAEGDRAAMKTALGERHNVSATQHARGERDDGPEVFATMTGLLQIITEQRKELASERKKLASERITQEQTIKEVRKEVAKREREIARLKALSNHKEAMIAGLNRKLASPLKLTEALLKTAVPGRFKKKAKGVQLESIQPDFLTLKEARSRVDVSDAPAQEIVRLYTTAEIDMQRAGELICAIFSDRTSKAFVRMVEQDADFEKPEFRILHKLYLGQYQGHVRDVDEVRNDWFALAKSDYRLTQADQLYFLLAAILPGSLSLVEMILEDSPSLTADNMPSTYKTGILRLAAGMSREDYETWRHILRLTPLEALKIVEIDIAAGHQKTITHKALVQRLSETVPPHLEHELDTSIIPFFDRHESRMRWMDCRLNADTRSAFLEHIKGKLQAGQPWSLIRLGDGESYAWQDTLPAERVAMRERVWWGEELDQNMRTQISGRILDATRQADVLGVPSIFRFIRDTTTSLKSYRGHHSISGLLHVLEGVESLPETGREFTEDRIHQVCCDLPSIIDIAKAAKKVVIVSSILPEHLKPALAKYLDAEALHCVVVPTHTKTKGNEQYMVSPRPLPFLYEEIDAELAEKVEAGTLVIVAAGSIGKIFCETARLRGGVALDVGSMVDYWVGVKTRSVADIV